MSRPRYTLTDKQKEQIIQLIISAVKTDLDNIQFIIHKEKAANTTVDIQRIKGCFEDWRLKVSQCVTIADIVFFVYDEYRVTPGGNIEYCETVITEINASGGIAI